MENASRKGYVAIRLPNTKAANESYLLEKGEDPLVQVYPKPWVGMWNGALRCCINLPNIIIALQSN